MCIRDRAEGDKKAGSEHATEKPTIKTEEHGETHSPEVIACLLYTSDAADERSSVDLGGRRIIKKKKKR